jgi:cytochrome P450
MLVKPTPETLEFAQAFDYALLAASSRARQGIIAYLVPDKRFDDSVKICQRFVDRYVASALSDGGDRVKERPYIFLNELLGSGASAEHIRDQILAIIIGGRDTTAGTLSSLFWTLARRPDVVAKIKNEIDVLKGQRPSWEDLKSFKYLNMALKESESSRPPGLWLITPQSCFRLRAWVSRIRDSG